jgi:hypothetical protein
MKKKKKKLYNHQGSHGQYNSCSKRVRNREMVDTVEQDVNIDTKGEGKAKSHASWAIKKRHANKNITEEEEETLQSARFLRIIQ